jgi:callose synthase
VVLADAELVCVLVAGLMDLCMQHSLVSRDTLVIGVRMVLKLLVAAGWIVIFTVLYM